MASLAIALVLSLASANIARAADAQDLDAAETAYANLEYESAQKLAEKVLAQRGLTHEQLVRAYRVLGSAYAVLGRASQATEAYVKLLTYAPNERPDSSQTPRIQNAFAEALGFWAGFPIKPGIEASTVALRVNTGGTLRVRVHDPTHIAAKVVVGYRWGEAGTFVTNTTVPSSTMNLQIRPGPPNVARLDYYAQALDSLDNIVFEAANPTIPRTVFAEVAEPAGRAGTPGANRAGQEAGGKSVFARPIFWIATGIVLAGAGTAAIYFATQDPKTETLPPTGATLKPVLFCGATGDGRCH